MNIRHIYVTVLLVVVTAWFGEGPISQSRQIKEDAHASSALVQVTVSPGLLGIDPSETAAGGKCNIEFINSAPMSANVHDVAKNSPISFAGWAMDDQKERLPEQVIVRFTNSASTHFYVSARIGLKRNDVRDYFKLSDRILGAGFDLNLDARELSSGIYALTLIMQFDDRTYVCDNGRKINLK